MRQILAIFSKDVRRFWPEILVSFGLLAALVREYPHVWNDAGMIHTGIGFFGFAGGPAGFLASSLVALIPISWWVMIARLIHCERLVGDTQFWITRPYRWPALLAAKVLFLVAFVYAPFFAAQCLLLNEGGFDPARSLPGLLLNLFFLTAAFVLPLIALAALTTGFGRMTLLVLGTVLFIIAAAIVSNYLPSSTFGSVPDIVSETLGFSILLCGIAAIVLMQYARHHVRLAWLLLGATAAGVWAITILDPDQAMMNRHYPAAAAPVQFAYAGGGAASLTEDKKLLSIPVPVHESGVGDGEVVVPVALRATIEGSRGTAWQSAWQGITSERYLPGEADTTMHFVMPGAVYDRLKSTPVTLRLTFALVEARRGASAVVPLSASDFAVAGFGVCRGETFFGRLDDFTGVSCRSPMGPPELTHIVAQWTDGRCSDASAKSGAHVLSTAWAGELDPGLAEFGITSVWDTPVNLSNQWLPYHEGGEPGRRNLCAGAPLAFTQFRETAHTQMDLVIPNYRLPEMAVGDRILTILPQSQQ